MTRSVRRRPRLKPRRRSSGRLCNYAMRRQAHQFIEEQIQKDSKGMEGPRFPCSEFFRNQSSA